MRRYSNEGREDKAQNKKKREESPESSEEHSGREEKEEDPKETTTEEKKEIFVRNLSFKTTEDEFKAFFEKYGKINRVNLLQRDGRSKGMGFIEYSNNADAEKLIKANKELELDGRQLSINWANEKKSPQEMTDAKTKTIFVGNLSFKATESSIEDFFNDCGKVVAVRIAKLSDGKSKGFCHVDFEDEDGVTNALKKNGEEFEGRNIKVDKTLPRNNDPDRREGYGRDRGFRGGRGFGNRGGRGGYDRGYDRRDNRNDRDRGSYRRNERSRDRD